MAGARFAAWTAYADDPMSFDAAVMSVATAATAMTVTVIANSGSFMKRSLNFRMVFPFVEGVSIISGVNIAKSLSPCEGLLGFRASRCRC